jgi:2-phospho-L-lactate transferase/gluconeogenesis factor (CofD/UPF0052 family)
MRSDIINALADMENANGSSIVSKKLEELAKKAEHMELGGTDTGIMIFEIYSDYISSLINK